MDKNIVYEGIIKQLTTESTNSFEKGNLFDILVTREGDSCTLKKTLLLKLSNYGLYVDVDDVKSKLDLLKLKLYVESINEWYECFFKKDDRVLTADMPHAVGQKFVREEKEYFDYGKRRGSIRLSKVKKLNNNIRIQMNK